MSSGPTSNSGARVSLVVGGTKGIGREVSLQLAQSGPVFASYFHDTEAADALVADATAAGLSVAALSDDVRTKQGVDNLVDTVLAGKARIDTIVFAAVEGYITRLEDVTEEAWHRVFATNVAPFLWLGQRVPDAQTTRLIAITSPWSHRYGPGYAVVGPSKAALESLVVYLAVELGVPGTTVNAVSAGLVDTELTRQRVPAKNVEKLAQRSPAGRIGRPAEVAGLVRWLASEDADWVTGQMMTMDGGYFLR